MAFKESEFVHFNDLCKRGSTDVAVISYNSDNYIMDEKGRLRDTFSLSIEQLEKRIATIRRRGGNPDVSLPALDMLKAKIS